MESAFGIFGGILGLIILVFAFVLAVAWIVLPFIIYSKLSAIEKHLAQIGLNAETQHRYKMAALQSIITNTAIAGEALQGARIEVPPQPPA